MKIDKGEITMSWSLLLLKQDTKTWKEQLPSTFGGDWARILKFYSLTQDKEGNQNVPLEDNEFINDITNGNYSKKGLKGTVEQLEEWKENPTWRQMPAISSLYTGPNAVTRGFRIGEIINRFVEEVLPKLKDRYITSQRKSGEKTQFKVRSKWNKTDNIIQTLEGENPFGKHIKDLNESQQKELLDEFNEKIYDRKKKQDKKLISATLEYIPSILQDLGYTDRIKFIIRKGKLPQEDWDEMDWEQTLGKDVTLTKRKGGVITSEFDKRDLSDIREEIKSLYSRHVDNKIIVPDIVTTYLPIVELFGLRSRVKSLTMGEGQERKEIRLDQSQLLQRTKEEFSKYQVNPNFGFKEARYFYKEIMLSGNEYLPEKFSTSRLMTGRKGKERKGGNVHSYVLTLLGDTYSNMDNVFQSFMEDSKNKIYKDDKAIQNSYVNALVDNPKATFRGDGEQRVALSDSTIEALLPVSKKERERIVREEIQNPESEVYKLFRNDKEISNILPYQVTDKEIEFINKLNIPSLIEKIEDGGQERGIELIESLKGIDKQSINTKTGLNYLSPPNRKKLDNFIFNIQLLDENEFFEVFGDEDGGAGEIIAPIFDQQREEVETLQIEENDSLNEFLSGLEGGEKDIGRMVYHSHLAEKDFEEIVGIDNSKLRYSLEDAFGFLAKLGTLFRLELGGENYYSHIRDLAYDKENPPKDEDVKKSIKDLYAAITRDVPKIRDALRDEAKKKVEEILEHPEHHLVGETKQKAKMKTTQSLLNKLKNNKLIIGGETDDN